MDEKDKLIQQMKLDYEAQLLAKDREWDRKVCDTAENCVISNLQHKHTLSQNIQLCRILAC